MTKFRVVKEEGEYVLEMLAADGVWEWVGYYATRKEAQAEIDAIRAGSPTGADAN